jgi:hypothetical protein
MDALDSKTDRWRCTARNRLGVRCGRAPIVGGTVCKFHGGGAPQVREAALDRLRALQPKALVVLEDLLEREEYPTVQIAAVRDILDRTEGKAAETVTVKSITEQPIEKMSDEDFAKTVEEGLDRWKKHVAARERARQ